MGRNRRSGGRKVNPNASTHVQIDGLRCDIYIQVQDRYVLYILRATDTEINVMWILRRAEQKRKKNVSIYKTNNKLLAERRRRGIFFFYIYIRPSPLSPRSRRHVLLTGGLALAARGPEHAKTTRDDETIVQRRPAARTGQRNI